MAGQHAEIAGPARNHHHVGLLRKQQALGRDQFEGDLAVRHRYAASAAMLRAFSMASSMVPTM